MATGKVKWFDDAKKYGFLAQDDGEDVFVHAAGVEPDKGLKAVRVRAVEGE
jgi:CspA family cold shock protein